MKVTERAARPGRPLAMAPRAFLRAYWQKRPLLVRGAFPEASRWLNRRELLSIAHRSGSSTRIVSRERGCKRLRLRYGPFSRKELVPPSDAPWTVLVNDLEKHLPERFADLFEAFGFLPQWRIDDLMASFATPGGSVGAHVDQYDVFLIQAQGRREWRLDLRSAGWYPWPGSDLRLVRGFKPIWRALLEPGDLLYLPPGVPHHGIASDECITFSLGMRAPALGDLFGALADALLAADEPLLLADPDLSPRSRSAELADEDLRRMAKRLGAQLADRDAFAAAIGRFLSTWRGQPLGARGHRLTDPLQSLAEGGHLRRRSWLRAVWWREGERTCLAIGGEVFSTSTRLAELLCGLQSFGRAELPDPSPEECALLRELAAYGALEVVRPARPCHDQAGVRDAD